MPPETPRSSQPAVTGAAAQRTAEQGCTLEVFASGKDYFARLFELGITALRLSTDG